MLPLLHGVLGEEHGPEIHGGPLSAGTLVFVLERSSHTRGSIQGYMPGKRVTRGAATNLGQKTRDAWAFCMVFFGRLSVIFNHGSCHEHWRSSSGSGRVGVSFYTPVYSGLPRLPLGHSGEQFR
jgi:hypothetical protein